MRGFVINIEGATVTNTNFRKVLYTSHYSQLVVMSLKPGEEIGMEVHGLDQFIRVEEGDGQIVLNGEGTTFSKDYAAMIPAGTLHNVINTSKDKEMKLYTLYSPPEHAMETVVAKKEQAVEEHFDGRTSVE